MEVMSDADLNPLTALSPLDGRYRNRVADLEPFASEGALIRTRLEVEARFLAALADAGVIRKLTAPERKRLLGLADELADKQLGRVKKIEETTRHDVKAAELGLRELLAKTSLKDVTGMIHFGLTSEDVNNLAYRLMLHRGLQRVVLPTIREVIQALAARAKRYQALPMLARTHGQAAVPTTLGKELAVFAVRLHRTAADLAATPITGKLGGAVGNYNALALAAPKVDWPGFSGKFIGSLGLKPNLITTQINPYDDVVAVCQKLHLINSITTGLNQDIWRYISDDWFRQAIKPGEVGSSVMTHKVNPIDFENSEGNLVMANALLEGLARKLPISRLQRDLSDSTTVRNLGSALGYSLLAYRSTLTGLSRIKPNEAVIRADLNRNWAILGEAVQTVLRREGVNDPYSLVAKATKGRHLTADSWPAFVGSLPVGQAVKNQLKKLSPETYVGKAVTLTKQALVELKHPF